MSGQVGASAPTVFQIPEQSAAAIIYMPRCDDTALNRQSGVALSMLMTSLWMGQTALTESGLFSAAWGIATVTLICLSGAILSGAYDPEAIPTEELSPLPSRIIIALLLTCVIASLLIFSLDV